MDVTKAKTALMQLKEGGIQTEGWFLRNRNFTKDELAELVSLGFLERIEKDPKDFMSEVRYRLTKEGMNYCWSKR